MSAFMRSIRMRSLNATLVMTTRSRSSFSNPYRRQAVWGAAAAAAFVTVSVAASRQAIHLDSEPVNNSDEKAFIDPETDISFPPMLRVSAKVSIPPLSFLGAGVRRVSVLQVKVYSIGIYADLSNPNIKLTPNMTAEEKIEHIVQNTAVVLRIVPTRTTSYSHLRDAFVRNLQQRTALARKAGSIPAEQEQEVQSAIRKLKSLFPTTSLEKHTPLDIFIPEPSPNKPRALVFRDLGAVENDWASTEFVLSYVDARALSPALKKEILLRAETL